MRPSLKPSTPKPATTKPTSSGAPDFRDMYLPDTDKVAIDLTRLHDFEAVTPPSSL